MIHFQGVQQVVLGDLKPREESGAIEEEPWACRDADSECPTRQPSSSTMYV